MIEMSTCKFGSYNLTWLQNHMLHGQLPPKDHHGQSLKSAARSVKIDIFLAQHLLAKIVACPHLTSRKINPQLTFFRKMFRYHKRKALYYYTVTSGKSLTYNAT